MAVDQFGIGTLPGARDPEAVEGSTESLYRSGTSPALADSSADLFVSTRTMPGSLLTAIQPKAGDTIKLELQKLSTQIETLQKQKDSLAQIDAFRMAQTFYTRAGLFERRSLRRSGTKLGLSEEQTREWKAWKDTPRNSSKDHRVWFSEKVSELQKAVNSSEPIKHILDCENRYVNSGFFTRQKLRNTLESGLTEQELKDWKQWKASPSNHDRSHREWFAEKLKSLRPSESEQKAVLLNLNLEKQALESIASDENAMASASDLTTLPSDLGERSRLIQQRLAQLREIREKGISCERWRLEQRRFQLEWGGYRSQLSERIEAARIEKTFDRSMQALQTELDEVDKQFEPVEKIGAVRIQWGKSAEYTQLLERIQQTERFESVRRYQTTLPDQISKAIDQLELEDADRLLSNQLSKRFDERLRDLKPGSSEFEVQVHALVPQVEEFTLHHLAKERWEQRFPGYPCGHERHLYEYIRFVPVLELQDGSKVTEGEQFRSQKANLLRKLKNLQSEHERILGVRAKAKEAFKAKKVGDWSEEMNNAVDSWLRSVKTSEEAAIVVKQKDSDFRAMARNQTETLLRTQLNSFQQQLETLEKERNPDSIGYQRLFEQIERSAAHRIWLPPTGIKPRPDSDAARLLAIKAKISLNLAVRKDLNSIAQGDVPARLSGASDEHLKLLGQLLATQYGVHSSAEKLLERMGLKREIFGNWQATSRANMSPGGEYTMLESIGEGSYGLQKYQAKILLAYSEQRLALMRQSSPQHRLREEVNADQEGASKILEQESDLLPRTERQEDLIQKFVDHILRSDGSSESLSSILEEIEEASLEQVKTMGRMLGVRMEVTPEILLQKLGFKETSTQANFSLTKLIGQDPMSFLEIGYHLSQNQAALLQAFATSEGRHYPEDSPLMQNLAIIQTGSDV
ncbi:MAG: hypothetical protein I8H75_01255 [Myxococcaceae bacterium]|nr:hypothetical protein [Myxococcaceae bacterium]MBH2005969.1 hypothetical protein [Myxococcaceae bacterium]